jgi:uridine kinase/ribulose-5-phosphate 4-epimerase/fuculose-1-phosphate aldolase
MVRDYSCTTIGKNMAEYKPYVISVAGDSGSGKSTISNFIQLYYGYENTTLISGDDLHRWERGDSNWEKLTHLNPDANNLKLGDLQLLSLKEGVKILRKKYNHKNGKFDELKTVYPNKYIINEGLHAFYTKNSEILSDLKIYIDIEEDFRIDLKIQRDTIERGYKKYDVFDLIEKRRKDSENIKSVQLKKADVIIKIKRGYDIEIECKKDVDYLLFDFIKKIHKELYQFEWINKTIGENLSLVQSKGGNISVKMFDKLIIKESGGKIKDVNYNNGYSIFNYKKFDISKISNDTELHRSLIDAVKNSKYKKPSMEAGFHISFKKYVFHLHPIYLNCILCISNSKKIIKNIFHNMFDYDFIEYYNPGYEITKTILEKESIKDIVFLQNHGIIVSSDEYHNAINLISIINKMAKDYIKNNVKDFEEFYLQHKYIDVKKQFSWPDSVILNDDETQSANNYINYMGNQIGIIEELKEQNILYLKNMESEKYRI